MSLNLGMSNLAEILMGASAVLLAPRAMPVKFFVALLLYLLDSASSYVRRTCLDGGFQKDRCVSSLAYIRRL